MSIARYIVVPASAFPAYSNTDRKPTRSTPHPHSTDMSLISTFFNDPLYSEFDRLFDEAFSRRTGTESGSQVARQNAAPRLLRPA